jgi:hypothetical protein
MSGSDEWLLRQRRRKRWARAQPAPEAELEQPPKRPLVTQGARSPGMPPGRRETIDDVIRSIALSGRIGAPGGWQRLF